MNKYPIPNPCNSCVIQARLERWQRFWERRNTFAAMGYRDDNPMYGIAGCQSDLRDLFCDGCKRRQEYLARIYEPVKQYAQDDNYITPQYETTTLLEFLGLSA